MELVWVNETKRVPENAFIKYFMRKYFNKDWLISKFIDKRNLRDACPPISLKTEQWLKKYFYAHNKQFAKLIEKDLSSWDYANK